MKKGRKQRLIGINLAILMLLSSVGYSLDMHYCQGKMKTFSIFGHAKTCSELEVKTSCHFHQSSDIKVQEIDRKKCCADRSAHVQMEAEYTAQTISPVTFQLLQAFVASFCCNHSQLISEVQRVKYLNYRPPLISSDALVLYQVFLI